MRKKTKKTNVWLFVLLSSHIGPPTVTHDLDVVVKGNYFCVCDNIPDNLRNDK